MKENQTKRILFTALAAALLIIVLIIVYGGRSDLSENPLKSTRYFEEPSNAVTTEDGLVVVTDRGKTRVSVLTGHMVSSTISGGMEGDGFFYAEHTVYSNGKIYIADVRFLEGSTKIIDERIIRFSESGRFEEVIFEKTYTDNMPLQYGNIKNMRVHDGVVYFLMQKDDDLELYAITGENAVLVRVVSGRDAPYLNSAFYDAVSDRVYTVAKNGFIYAEDESNSLKTIRGDNGGIPWDIAVDGAGGVFLADLALGGVVLLSGADVYLAGGGVIRLSINESGVISFTDGESVFQVLLNGDVIWNDVCASYSSGYFIHRLIIWLLAFVSAVTLLYLAIRFAKWLVEMNRTGQSGLMGVIVAATVVTALIVGFSIFVAFLERSDEKNEYVTVQTALSVSMMSGRTFGDDLISINSLSDYGGPERARIRETLDAICETASEQGMHMYYVLYKEIDGILCAVMDYEDYLSIYPIGEFVPGLNEIAEGNLSHLFVKETDANGTWAYAIAPIYGSGGEIVGILEIGYNLYMETLKTQGLVKNIVISTAVLVVLFLLVSSEGSALIAPITELRKLRDNSANIPEFIRPLIFLAFLTDSTATVFIPQLAGRIFTASGLGFSMSLGAALPISVKLFFISAAAVAGGTLIDRFGMKFMLVTGVFVEMAGLGVTSAAVALNSYALLVAGLCVSGCGLGVIVVSGNTLPASCEDEDRRNSLFSGVNVGMLSGIVVGTSIGSYVAQAVGYSYTFALSIIALIPAPWLALRCAPRRFNRSIPAQSVAARGDNRGVMRFLSNRNVFGFLLFMMFPFMVVMYFRDFVFPLYASEQAFSEVGIGQALLFSGAVSIFIAPNVTSALIKHLKAKWTNVLAGVLCAAGLLLFAAGPSLSNSIITVCALSFAGCFGYTAQSVYFSSVRAVKAFGTGKSMGIFTLFDNLSQTAGPLLFGAALILGYGAATLLIGAASIAGAILFALLSRSRELRTESDNEEEVS